ncbi:hypothetical protein PSC71_13505 [Devosia sp. J2-20]|nr:hypothetical protein [Devosia sp. J2-20]WDQ98237.1 hypothetical protein PSC71_13505 [Devosia sp. J2-20]|tara:strand:+ start:3143 stop:3265 length:123 start_codon:yes stop_codon:yes gene_type:complete
MAGWPPVPLRDIAAAQQAFGEKGYIGKIVLNMAGVGYSKA